MLKTDDFLHIRSYNACDFVNHFKTQISRNQFSAISGYYPVNRLAKIQRYPDSKNAWYPN